MDDTPKKTPALIDPVELYLRREGTGEGSFLEGSYINFNGTTGQWTRDKIALPPLSQYLVNVHGLMIGWVKEGPDNKVIDRSQLGFMIHGFVPPDREQLGDLNPRHWPPKHRRSDSDDPWRPAVYMQMRSIETGDNLIFSPRADTQRNAINNFIAKYYRERHGGMFPIVTLSSRSFPNQHDGRTYVPVFQGAGWGL